MTTHTTAFHQRLGSDVGGAPETDVLKSTDKNSAPMRTRQTLHESGTLATTIAATREDNMNDVQIDNVTVEQSKSFKLTLADPSEYKELIFPTAIKFIDRDGTTKRLDLAELHALLEKSKAGIDSTQLTELVVSALCP